MASSNEIISTDRLLNANPVYLNRRPNIDRDRYEYRYSVVRAEDHRPIGFTSMYFFSANIKRLCNPEIWQGFEHQGYGLAMYVAASEQIGDFGENPVLQADVECLDPTAQRVWDSLVRRGLAEGSLDPLDPYRFLKAD